MTDRTIIEELRELATQIANGPDDVAEFGADIARQFRERHAAIVALLAVDAMVAGDEGEIDEDHPQLVALREELRNRLRCLVAWARQTGRM